MLLLPADELNRLAISLPADGIVVEGVDMSEKIFAPVGQGFGEPVQVEIWITEAGLPRLLVILEPEQEASIPYTLGLGEEVLLHCVTVYSGGRKSVTKLADAPLLAVRNVTRGLYLYTEDGSDLMTEGGNNLILNHSESSSDYLVLE